MGFYDKIKSQQVSRGGSYMKPGKYKVRIKNVKEVQSSQNAMQVFFVIEFIVLESDNPEIKVGSERSQVIKLADVMALPNIKGFIAAASGIDPTIDNDELNEQVESFWSELLEEEVEFPRICEIITGSANPLEDAVLGLECVLIKTKEKNDFTKHKWQARNLDDEEAAA